MSSSGRMIPGSYSPPPPPPPASSSSSSSSLSSLSSPSPPPSPLRSLPTPMDPDSSSSTTATSTSMTEVATATATTTTTTSTNTATTTTTTTTVVKFAPLPQLAPRKRRSNLPMGVAARAQLMQKRRVRYGGGEGAPRWASDPVDPRTGDFRPGMIDPDERDDLEDMFIVMGKFVKDASRHLWKRMSKKRGKQGGAGDAEKEDAEEEEEGPAEGGGHGVNGGNGGDGKEDEIRQVVFIEGEEGVAIEFPKGLSQTETVGRGYAWRTVSVIATPKEAINSNSPDEGALRES